MSSTTQKRSKSRNKGSKSRKIRNGVRIGERSDQRGDTREHHRVPSNSTIKTIGNRDSNIKNNITSKYK